MRVSKLVTSLLRVLWLALAASIASIASVAVATTPDPTTLKKMSALAVPFVPNAGQWDARAAFAAQTFAGTLFVTKQGELVYSLPGKPINTSPNDDDGGSTPSPATRERDGLRAPDKHNQAQQRTPGWVLSETLVDAKGDARRMSQSTLKSPAGYRPMEGKVSYGIGNDESKHANNLNTYERVNLGEMYPGINVQLRATGNNVEKIFTVAPTHDPKQIHIALKGANKLEIGTQGELIAHTGNGPVAFTAPIAFQETASGERTPVQVAYALNADQQRYSFALGEYDATQPLVIDPLLQSTYLGGTGSDRANAMAIHPASGEVYVSGSTDSTDLPGVSGGAKSANSSSYDAFVTRFDAALTTRLQSSYFGGTGVDYGLALAISSASGEVYVAGSTGAADLPGVSGGAQSGMLGSSDGFVTRFNATLTTLLQSTYHGGTGVDGVFALAIHPASGEVYVTGVTNSTDLPGVNGGAQSAKSLLDEAFVTRFNAALTTRLQSSYLGGKGNDAATALAIHPASGEVYVAGYTSSTDLPGVGGGAQSAHGSGEGSAFREDAFVTRFDTALTTRLQSTYLGGFGTDFADALAIHPVSGEVYVAGQTWSALPGVGGGAQGGAGGVGDGFVTRFNATLSTLLQSTYVGGSDRDQATALAIHPTSGEVYVAGYTDSFNLNGVDGGAQNAKAAGTDAFVTRFNAELTLRLQASYLGGTGSDYARALAIHPASGDVYLAGYSSSTDLPGVGGGAQSASSAGLDAFVSRLTADLRNPAGCSLDIDYDFAVRANTDGLLILRRMLGLSGPALIANAVNPDGLRTGHIGIGNSIDALLVTLDIDGSGGAADGASDGLILLRAMLGFTGTAVTAGAISGTPPRNTWELIRPYLNTNCGTSFLP